MNTRGFLTKLLPDTGWVFTATPVTGGKGWINTAHTTIDSAVAHITKLTWEHKAAYFALAAYAQERVWDATWTNPHTKQVEGKWRQRTQANAQSIRSFFLDLDIDADDNTKFPTREEALKEFEAFRVALDLPHPMIVDSGGGYHIYWPLIHAVPVAEWRPVAEQLKHLCVARGFRIDRSVPADPARVLRALGGYNVRRHAPTRLLQDAAPISFADFKTRVDGYVATHGMQMPEAKPIPGNDGLGWGAVDNLGATNDPINLDRVAFHCQQIGMQVATRGATTGEQLWRATLGIVKFCEPQDVALHAVSDGHPQFDPGDAATKLDHWRTGPSACTHFHQHNPLTCETCPHWQKITSPAQLGRMVREKAAPKIELVDLVSGQAVTAELPTPPERYKRRAHDGAVLVATEAEGMDYHEIICPWDFYPIKIMRQSGHDAAVEERSMWRAHLPRMAPVDMDIPQATVSDGRKLYAILMAKGLYLTPEQFKAVQLYMSAYLQKLAEEADREKLYERLGWHADHNEFVLGDVVLMADGTVRAHQPSRAIRAVTKEGVKRSGSLDGWRHAIQFFNRPGYEGARFFLYASFGAPLFHLNDTGNKGVLLCANGLSGRGKTTTLKACASVWGEPDNLIINGNKDGSTVNAMYEALGTYHSLPFLWDDITEREDDEIRKILLNVSQGTGKMRMRDSSGIGDRHVTWNTMVLASANVDHLMTIMSTGKNVDPHLMRLVGVDFGLIDASAPAKQLADNFIRQLKNNHGHAGPLFMRTVLTNFERVRKTYIDTIAKVDTMLNSSNASAERYWSAAVAAAYTGASIARFLGLLPNFPLEQDLDWMIGHLGTQRQAIAESRHTPSELFAEFLEAHVSNTLVIAPREASNLDGIALRPHGPLLIRHEMHTNLMWVARSAIMDYCSKHKTSFRALEASLERLGVITARNTQKVLGADSAYAKGQSRTWRIDTRMLGPTPAVTLAASNVAPLKTANGGKP